MGLHWYDDEEFIDVSWTVPREAVFKQEIFKAR